MTALQMEFNVSSIALANDVLGFVRVTSGNVPTVNARDDEIPNLVASLAS